MRALCFTVHEEYNYVSAVETSRHAQACDVCFLMSLDETSWHADGPHLNPTASATFAPHHVSIAAINSRRYAPIDMLPASHGSTRRIFSFPWHMAWLSRPMPDLQPDSAARLALMIALVCALDLDTMYLQYMRNSRLSCYICITPSSQYSTIKTITR